ncbi:MAG: aminotransferase class III-fold pyridoxal phosphate-dependent enzyme [Alphaproteobacteria bacterium]|nr:aminotransferase class III-fold pyridoxal phosphate-dependent enzyme [Alphaproteobacteria bacterium]
MPDNIQTNSKIVAAYRERTPGSARLAVEAQGLMPSGITHDSRQCDPYGIYVERAQGSRKWDVDGNEYVDYFGGHGALLLGHNHPAVLEATQKAMALGTHFGANHPGEVRWAALVKRMVPSAERVRFTASGTEATLMALRLARAFTGKPKVVRFLTHFHGWHDHMTAGHASHFDGTPTAGVVAGIAEHTILLPPGDTAAMRALFQRRDDIAAAILEPTGASFGMVPHPRDFVAALREETRKAGSLLIFDEVVTGFRVSPGGAQQEYGILPDLTSLAKILAGGLPGGAIAGRRDILDELDFKAAPAKGHEKIAHPGTYNGNPVSAAAGVAALGIIAGGDACARANAYAAELRQRVNQELASAGTPWAMYGTFSGFHMFLNAKRRPIDPLRFDPLALDDRELTANPKALAQKFRLALLANGIDVNGKLSGVASAVHDKADLERTVDGFRAALAMLRAEEELPAAAA